MNFTSFKYNCLVSLFTFASLITFGIKDAKAASPITMNGNFVIENANNRNMVVDKFGDNPAVPANAHQYSKANPRTYTLYGVRSNTGSYEVHLASSPNLCFTAAGGLNPNMPNGTLAIFSNNCANSLNLVFMDDNTVRIGRNLGMCLTNQGNRYNQMFNKLHFWQCDGSPETKFVFTGAAAVTSANKPVTKTIISTTPKTKNNTITIQGDNSGSAGVIGGGLIFVGGYMVEKLLDGATQMPNVISVSLDRDGESWESASLKCQRKGGYLKWHINVDKDYAEKTCFANQ